MKQSIIIGLDGTLSNNLHRIDFLYGKDYDGYHSKLFDDTPNKSIVWLLNLFNNRSYIDLSVICLSYRPDEYLPQTINWLNFHDIPVDRVILRPNDQYAKEDVYKVSRLLEIRKEHGEIALAIDDREDVLNAYKNYGLNCLQVL